MKEAGSMMAVATLALWATACGGGGGAGGTGGANGGPGTGGAHGGAGSGGSGAAGNNGGPLPDPKALRGEIRIVEGVDGHRDAPTEPVTEQSYSRLDAHFDPPDMIAWHTDVMTSDTCTLKKFVPSSCPGDFCDGVCVAQQCRPFNSYVDAGKVTITGLKIGVAMTASTYGNYYYPENIVLPVDLYATGATVTAHAVGAAPFPAFDAVATAPGVLTTTSIANHELTLPPHADTRVTWTPDGGPNARVRLTLNANNHSHGQPFEAIIVCEAADSAGAITIPKEMVDAFPATENWQACVLVDCPRSMIQRLVRGVATLAQPLPGDGWVGLTVGSEISFGVVHRP